MTFVGGLELFVYNIDVNDLCDVFYYPHKPFCLENVSLYKIHSTVLDRLNEFPNIVSSDRSRASYSMRHFVIGVAK